MDFKRLTKDDSRRIMENFMNNPKPDYDESYDDMRKSFETIYSEVRRLIDLDNEESKWKYLFDLNFGLRIYEALNSEYGFNTRLASDDGIWRYISLKVIPDIVYTRWGDKPVRFWSDPRRLWIKSIWWYIHLSWQGSIEKTNEILRGFTTDEIMQLTERPGLGYQVELSRVLMRVHSKANKYIKEIRKQSKRNKRKLWGILKTPEKNDTKEEDKRVFRKIMKLNIARTKVVDPALYEGGIEGYVRDLYDYFEIEV